MSDNNRSEFVASLELASTQRQPKQAGWMEPSRCKRSARAKSRPTMAARLLSLLGFK